MDQTRICSESELHSLLQQHPAPAYVKHAGVEADLSQLAAGQFADSVGRQFPLHTKSAVWTSACIFFNKFAGDQQTYPQVKERLFQQARLFGILADVVTLEKQATTSEPASVPDEHYAFVQNGERHLPLRNTAEVHAAVNWLQKHAAALPLRARQDIADRVLTRAADLRLSLDTTTQDRLEKTAGHGTRGSQDVVHLLLSRATAAAERKQPQLEQEFTKLAAAVRAEPGLSHDTAFINKIQDTVDQADRLLDVTVHYGHDIQPPEEYLFGITKRALLQQQEQYVPLVNGSVYHKTALAHVRLHDVREQLGDEVADAVTQEGLFVDMVKLSQVLPTLPRQDADAFDRLAKRQGFKPAIKQAAADEAVADTASLQRLGDYYIEHLMAG